MTRRSKYAQFNKDLPYDIMLDIITRLPFESIMALKCVSKQWKHAINDPKVSNRFIVDDKLVTFRAGDTFNCLFLMTDKDDAITNRAYPPFTVRRVPLPDPTKQQLKPKRVCDGMASYYRFSRCSASHFVFHNLLTGASHTIRKAPQLKYSRAVGNEDDDSSWPWTCYGFGYDAYDEDYKMMVVCNYNFDETQTKEHDTFWVYSFKKGSWVRFSGFPYDFFDWTNNLHIAYAFDGKLYWIVCAYVDEEKVTMILIYDLHTCGFWKIHAPGVYDSDEGGDIDKGNLMELGGQLCYWSCDENEIAVWVLNEEEDTWTMLLNMTTMMWGRQFRSMEPVTMYRFRDGRELMLFVCPRNGSLCWYNLNDDEVVKVVHQSTWLNTRVVGLRQP